MYFSQFTFLKHFSKNRVKYILRILRSREDFFGVKR